MNEAKDCINGAGVQVKAIRCDLNELIKHFFAHTKPFHKNLGSLSTECINYWLFDFVYLQKICAIYGLRKKTGELVFYVDQVPKVATWEHLKKLFDLEQKSLVTLSNLNEIADFPKPIKRQ